VDVPPAPTAAAPLSASANRPEPHRQAIWRYLRALGACPEEADDLLQETMLVGCSVELAAEPELARAFLRGVARNQWLRSRRWWQRRREQQIAAAVDELWAATAATDDGDELVDRLRHCLGRLQPRARQALDLHYRDGLLWPDVAARIGLRPNGTKTLVQRARQALRECIERRHA
jgi:RNA polymerase sigma-70 factor (ECF subfamily)